MEKKVTALILFSIASCASCASAQSAVTVYGSFDGGIRRLSNTDAAGGDKVTVSSTGMSMSNRLGFRGSEDIGNGYDVHFVLESGFNSGTGGLDAAGVLFNRTATIGIGGPSGSLNIGRQYTVAFKTILTYEPLGYRFPLTTYTVAASAGIRYNNSFQYAGTFGPLTVRADYAMGEQAGNARNGMAKSLGASYVVGNVVLGGAYTRREMLVESAYRNNSHVTAGAAFKYGELRGAIGFADERQETASRDTRIRCSWAGGEYQITPFTRLGVAYYRNDTRTAVARGNSSIAVLAAFYTLSVRSSLYAELDRSTFEGSLALSPAQRHQTGISVGLNHLF